MKTALIAGGTGKLGNHISKYLAQNGYNLIIIYHASEEKKEKLAKELQNFNIKFKFIKANLTKHKEIKFVFEIIKKELSSLNLLINVAAIFNKKSISEITEQDWNEVIDLNLKASFFLAKYSYEIMERGSVIINFSSVGGFIPWKDRSLYFISKNGINALTKTLALEFAPSIRVNAIAPGYIELENNQTKELMPLDKIPLQKYGKIENVIQTIDFMLKNDFLTGVVIPLDGGRVLLQ